MSRRRALTLAVMVSLFLVSVVPAQATSVSGRFVDDDGVPGELDLERLAELGVIHGCNPPANTHSCANASLSRAEAFKILVGAGQVFGKLPAYPSTTEDRFTDDDTMWGGAVSRISDFLAVQRIINGCNPPANTRVCPAGVLSRGAVAKMVVLTFGLTAPDGYSSPWKDVSGAWYAEPARVGAFNGLWDSTSGQFDGDAAITRADFAHVVMTAAGETRCEDNPFTAKRIADLEAKYPRQSFTAYAYDTRSRCAYWMNPDARLRTASVFKVMVMAGTLLEAQTDGRPLSSWERSRLVPMITESANQPVRDLWRHFGASPWFRRQARIFGLDETVPVGDTESVWGRETTSAKDQGELIRQILLGDWGPLDSEYRDEAWDLMTSVVPSQTWGITAGVPSGWTVAQKNGFAGHIANSVGFVEAPGTQDGYVIAVLTNGWSDWTRGVPVVEGIAGWVSAELAH